MAATAPTIAVAVLVAVLRNASVHMSWRPPRDTHFCGRLKSREKRGLRPDFSRPKEQGCGVEVGRPKAFPVGTAFVGGCSRWICYERPRRWAARRPVHTRSTISQAKDHGRLDVAYAGEARTPGDQNSKVSSSGVAGRRWDTKKEQAGVCRSGSASPQPTSVRRSARATEPDRS